MQGCTKPGRLNFLPCFLMNVGHRFGTCFLSPYWRLEFWACTKTFGKFVYSFRRTHNFLLRFGVSVVSKVILAARGSPIVWDTGPKGCGFDSRWFHWNSSLTQSFPPHYGPGVDSASIRNEYQEYFLEVKAAGA